ncbi:hypothetical protein [Arthrobacter cavernae]|uniref:N-acetyl-1-D-myo-inositol-2-amino-2-deoxy-alpha-D-glucopyranoside deacetylase n=1 Tax=Arthrobacter cavernae TaxID=2817681 RepID=A0A939KLK0_9MICC|nr:hypothetical protein [Arthrobacter cavernae]MBO1267343.1 hypothetical protein [Arthrobacter cavernae]
MNKRVAGTARGLAAAVPAALFAALAGTALHRQSVVIAGVDVPWGAAAALVLLAAVQLWLAAWSRSLLPTAVAGIGCYAAVGALAAAGPGKQLILGDPAGNIWVYGIAGVTIAMLIVAAWLRRRSA